MELLKKQIYTIEQLFDTNDPAFLKTVPSAGWSYPVYTLKEELQFNVGSLPGLSAKEEGGIKGIIKKTKRHTEPVPRHRKHYCIPLT